MGRNGIRDVLRAKVPGHTYVRENRIQYFPLTIIAVMRFVPELVSVLADAQTQPQSFLISV